MQQNPQETLAQDTELGGYNETTWRQANIVCGGFPCQDISNAGRRAGITGERSSLWAWLCGTICVVRPLYAIVENVAALLGNGMDTVIGDLAEIGYDTEWDCISAQAVGAPHRRDRIWIVAYPDNSGLLYGQSEKLSAERGLHALRESISSRKDVADCNADGKSAMLVHAEKIQASYSANSDSERLSKRHGIRNGGPQTRGIISRGELERIRATRGKEQWEVEPSVGRVADGIPDRVDRISALGNSLVPQIPELFGNAILEHGSA